MAGKTAAERAKDFLDGVLAHVPEDRRPAITEALTQEALNALGQGVLRQDEFSRHKDDLARQAADLQAKITANQTWYDENKPKVDRALEILAAGGNPDDDDPSLLDPEPRRTPMPAPTRQPALPPGITEDALKQVVASSEKGAIQFFGMLDHLKARHYKAFGELLDTKDLLDNPELTQIGLPALYEKTYAEQYAAKSQAELAKQLAEAEAKGKAAGIAEIQSKLGAQGPYPTPHALNGQLSPTVEALQKIHQETEGDASKLAARGFKNRFDEVAAATEYQQLVAAGAGGGQ
jgi:hypothetical protein